MLHEKLELAIELLNKGLGFTQVRRELQKEGLDRTDAMSIVEMALDQIGE